MNADESAPSSLSVCICAYLCSKFSDANGWQAPASHELRIPSILPAFRSHEKPAATGTQVRVLLNLGRPSFVRVQ
jgi:hypothetical protein